MSEYQKYSKLPYFRTPTSISKTLEQVKKLLSKYGLQAIRNSEIKHLNLGVIEFALEKNNKMFTFRFKFNLSNDLRYHKQIYRALFYYLKSRFTRVDYGICTIEEEFMQELLIPLPDGRLKTLQEAYGKNVQLLQAGKDLLLPFKDETK